MIYFFPSYSKIYRYEGVTCSAVKFVTTNKIWGYREAYWIEQFSPAKDWSEGSDVVGLRLLVLWSLGVHDVNRWRSRVRARGGVLVEGFGGGVRHSDVADWSEQNEEDREFGDFEDGVVGVGRDHCVVFVFGFYKEWKNKWNACSIWVRTMDMRLFFPSC